MKQNTLFIGFSVTLTLFFAGTILTTVGLFTDYWMTSENSDDVKVGLFHVCVETYSDYSEDCLAHNDYGFTTGYSFPDDAKFVACQIFVICAAILGVFTIVSCAIFILFSLKDNRRSKGPFIATMISAISCDVFLAGLLLIFGALIYDDVAEFYNLDYSFALTCLAAAFILIGCIVFPLITQPFLRYPQGVNGGIVCNANPQMVQQPFVRYDVLQQPGMQVSYEGHHTPQPV